MTLRVFGLFFACSLLFLGIEGCIVRAENPGRMTPADAGYVWRDVFVPPHECMMEEGGTDSDPFNCGSCGNVCDPTFSDRCFVGTCVCGLNPECNATQECRFGECRDTDLSGAVCEFDEECIAGYACIHGHCSFVQCVPEVCDGADNDCDGTIDGTTFSPLSRWCYDIDIPASAMLNPPCAPGVQVCDTGTWAECLGSVPPISEAGFLACDSLDNDCDGCPDGIRSSSGTCVPLVVSGFDIVYAIDISGSMGSTINAVRTATSTFSAIYRSDPDFRFGLVLFPLPDEESQVFLRLSDFATFETALAGVLANGGSEEPNWDVVAQLGTGELNIGWRRGAIRIIILFSDESAQTYTSPRNTEETMCAALTHGEVLAVVEQTRYFSSFDLCGLTFELTADPVEMVANLSTIITDPCSP